MIKWLIKEIKVNKKTRDSTQAVYGWTAREIKKYGPLWVRIINSRWLEKEKDKSFLEINARVEKARSAGKQEKAITDIIEQEA